MDSVLFATRARQRRLSKKCCEIGRAYPQKRVHAQSRFSIRERILKQFLIFNPQTARRRTLQDCYEKPLDLALQNDFRVLLVVPLWLT
jgi:hypothetical protein